MKLYTKENIEELEQKNGNSTFLNYFEPIIKKGTNFFVSNINCDIQILEIDDTLIPIAVTNENYQDSLYTSLLGHYIKYIQEEFEKFNIPFSFIFKLFEKYFIKNKINKTIYVNSWLISTNFYPQLNAEQVKQINEFLIEKFPNHSIVYKNIIKNYNKSLFDNLFLNDFKPIITRQIFIINKEMYENLAYRYRLKHRKDNNLYKKLGYKSEKANINDDFERIKDLYEQLYIKKYSEYNPKYTSEYFKLIHNNDLFTLKTLKKDENIDAMYIIISNDSKMTVPAVGYDRTLEKGLYRCIVSDLIKEFINSYELFNMSAGVGDFKIQRGAKPEMEYLMIYYKHLPLKKRIMFKLLEIAVNKTIPILCKHKLCGFVR